MSAYLLGQPFKTMELLEEYGFRQDYTLFLNLIKKLGYFIKIPVGEGNFRSVNYLHKKILEIGLSREKIEDQETLNLPIFL